jgi:hypothetical protein
MKFTAPGTSVGAACAAAAPLVRFIDLRTHKRAVDVVGEG